MEHLSVTTAIIGLLAVGGKTIDVLYDLNTSPQKNTAILNKTLQEVRQCRSSIHVLYKTLSLLEAAQLPFPDRGSWIGIDDLIATLTDTVLAFSDLQGICQAFGQGQGMAERTSMCAQFASKLGSLCARIRYHNLSLMMIATILKCPSEADAQNSRIGLERRMTRLLTSTSDLSARMRNLKDVFGVRALGRGTIPNYAPAAQNAPRLPADRTSVSSLSSSSSAGIRESGESDRAPRTRGWSVLASYALADVPVLSVVAIPVTTSELRNGNEFYTFDFAQRVSSDLALLMQCQPGHGTSKMLREILSKPMANNTEMDNTSPSPSPSVERVVATTSSATGVNNNLMSVKNSAKKKSALRHRILPRMKLK